jgi:hypothetical protein
MTMRRWTARNWSNREIVTQGVHRPKAVAKLLELLNRYSAKERTH